MQYIVCRKLLSIIFKVLSEEHTQTHTHTQTQTQTQTRTRTHTLVKVKVCVTCVFCDLFLWLILCEIINQTRLRRGNKTVRWARWRISIKDDCNPLFKLSSGCNPFPPPPRGAATTGSPAQYENGLINLPPQNFFIGHPQRAFSAGSGAANDASPV